MCFFHGAAHAEGGQPSGIDLHYVDATVRPQDDLYTYTSGKWLRETALPPDRARYGSFDQLRDKSELEVRAIIEELAANTDLPAGSEERKIADLYRSFMDETQIEKLDDQPLKKLFAHIDQIKTRAGIPQLIGEFNLEGLSTPVNMGVEPDERNSTRYVLHLDQGGIGLPDRDYFLKDDDAKMKSIRAAYQAHIARTFEMLGETDPAGKAARVVAFETALAKAQWSKVELRDPVKTYNKFSRQSLAELAPGYAWDQLLSASGVPLKAIDDIVVTTPSFFKTTSALLQTGELGDLRDYLKWQAARTNMPLMSKRFVDADFDFYGKTLRGIPENRPRWKRGVGLVEGALGEAIGKIYVARHFPPTAKARMDKLVGNLMLAYRQSIDGLSWMTPTTKAAAQAKLAKYTVKIGYPTRWRSYEALQIDAHDLAGNARRSAVAESERQIARLGKPIDREEWGMTPQTVNAYYNPVMNEIVFPAAILQPPFFNFEADDAVNYGGIGAVIGHEISHGFDDQGSQFDGDGNLRDWWTADDHKQFDERTSRLVAQYDAFESVPGYHVNGKLTLGENIADNSGLAISYKAYLLSLGGKEAPVIDKLTGPQRLYVGWAQVWRGKTRESEAIRLVKVDPHSPAAVRGNAPLVNQPGFYEAFAVKPGDKLYADPAARVTIW